MANDEAQQAGSGPSPEGEPEKQNNAAEDAALKAAQDAISQLGDMNNMVDAAATQAAASGDGARDFAQEMADAIAAEQAEKAAASGGASSGGGGGGGNKKPAGSENAKAFDLPNLAGELSQSQIHALDLLSDVHLNVKIELGRTRMLVEDLLRLGEGAVVELDKLAGDPVDVYVNERHVARGEVLVLNDNFCVRINEVLAVASESKEKGAA